MLHIFVKDVKLPLLTFELQLLMAALEALGLLSSAKKRPSGLTKTPLREGWQDCKPATASQCLFYSESSWVVCRPLLLHLLPVHPDQNVLLAHLLGLVKNAAPVVSTALAPRRLSPY